MLARWYAFVDSFITDKFLARYPDPTDYHRELRRARIQVGASFVAAMGVSLMVLGRLILGNVQPSLVASAAMALLSFITPYIGKRFGNFRVPFIVLLTLAIHAISLRVIATGGLHSTVVSWYSLAPIVGMLVVGRKVTIGLSLLAFVHILIIANLGIFGVQIPENFQPDSTRVVVFSTCLFLLLGSAIVYDIVTERYQRIMIDTKLKLGRQEKLASIGLLAAGVAHEVNNPLMILSGRLNLLKKLVSDPKMDLEKIHVHIDQSMSVIDRISEVTYGLLNYSGSAKDDSRSKVDLIEFVREIKESFRPQLEQEKVVLTLNAPSNPVLLKVNRMQMRQVVLVLLQNALDAITEGGEKVIVLEIQDNEEEVVIAVDDYGVGVSDEFAEKIMDPYFTTKDFGKARGLGLSISKGIVEQHSGRLELDPSVSHTRFCVTLPKNIEDVTRSDLSDHKAS